MLSNAVIPSILVGPDEQEVERLAGQIEVVYEPLPAILDVRKSDTVFFDYQFGRGDVAKAFAEADKVMVHYVLRSVQFRLGQNSCPDAFSAFFCSAVRLKSSVYWI